MEVFDFNFLSLFSIEILFAICLGTVAGLIIGALPGLGASIAIVLLLPVTYSLSPLAAILLLLAAYQSAEYGGSISSIILGIPGTGAAVATVLDGHPMAKKTSPGKALAYSLTASTVGGLFGGIILLFLSVPLAKFSLRLSDPEFFLIGVLGLLAVTALSSKDFIKSMISVVLGLMAGMVGIDLFTGSSRFIFGRPELMEGINIIVILVGLFALSEVFSMISKDIGTKNNSEFQNLKARITFKEFKGVSKSTGVGSVIGAIVGIIPGMASGASSWFAYSAAKKVSNNPETFGQGNPDGIAGPEAANNATVGGALIPLLALGIPGTAAIAIVMGAFIIHGIQPGPRIFTSEANLVYGIFYGFLLTTIFMYIIGKLITPMFSRVLKIPIYMLVPIILVLSLTGVFASKGLFFELGLTLLIGTIAFFMKKLEYSLPSFIMAFVLSPIIEESLRRTLILSDGSYGVFFTRIYSIILLLIISIFMIGVILANIRKGNNTLSN